MGATLELGMLGPIEVRSDRAPVSLGGPRQRALLADLALHPNQVVSVDRLVDDLWGEAPPATAVHTIQVFVSRLRRALGAAGERLLTRPPGYMLVLHADEVDADRFERLYDSARSALGGGDADQALGLLEQATALWRGPALDEFTYEPFAQAAIARLEELRVSAREDLIEAQLALGRHDEVVSDLEALIHEHPFRERPRAQLMLALYRCGRQAQALDAFRQARHALVEELGVEPGEALRELEQAILRQDPSLQAPASRRAPAATPSPAAPSTASGAVATAPVPIPTVPADAAFAPAAPTVRRTVTVLVARLSSIGEADPETTRSSIAIARARGEEVVVRHGGAFVAGLGGELAWVFGLPLVREDDALRAIHAADELRPALEAVDPHEPRRLTVHIGVSTGEVIADSPRDVFGDPVTQSVSLAQAAASGEILVGDETRRLAFTAIEVEPADDENAWRLLRFAERPRIPVGTGSPMVDREEELEHALGAFARVRRTGEANLLTVVGDAGVGKSRLVHELAAKLGGGATTLEGRCLSYGEGIAFWPLHEALTQAAGEESRAGIRRLLDGADEADVVADIVAAGLGLAPAESVGEQLPWAFRRTLEVLSEREPLLLVIDDVHWADTPLLDLIEYLVDWCRAPVLLVCLARPELLEARPSWGGGHAQVSSVVLRPLDDTLTDRLLDHKLGQRRLSESQRGQILRTAEGNPLFVEQLLQMSAEDPVWDEGANIPGTIQALLSARLDRLGPGERAYIEYAAVIGREFWPTAVRELLPAEARPSADQHLRALVHRGLIHPDRSIMAGEEQLRFHHILIRDVAYRGTPKALRGELHARFADWLVARGETYEEFVGYHLERAFRYRSEVGGVDAAARVLGDRAVDHLSAAGRRALSRGDLNAAVNLLRASVDLLDATGRSRPEVLVDLGSALSETDEFAEAEPVLQAALAQAPEDATVLRARASIELSYWRSRADPTGHVDEILTVADDAIKIFDGVGDDGGLSRAWFHVAWAHWIRSQSAAMEPALERALAHAERAGEPRDRSRALMYLARCFVYGPRPVSEAIPRCNLLLEHAAGDVPATAFINAMFAIVEAMDGRFADARRRWRESKERLTELGLTHTVAVIQMAYGFVELLGTTPELAEPELVGACEAFRRMGDQGRLSSAASILARLLYKEGRLEDSDRYSHVAEDCASEDDIEPQMFWRGTRAKILARAGSSEAAEQLSESAVKLARTTDFPLNQGDALSDHAEVMTLLGRPDDAARALKEAIDAYDRKGICVSVIEARTRLQTLVTDRVEP